MDRRKARRDSAVARAVRHMRDLKQRAGGVGFDLELLRFQAQSAIVGATVMSSLVLVLALGGTVAGLGASAAVWAMITVCCYAWLAFLARRAEGARSSAIEIRRTTFLACHFISGLGWTYLAALRCDGCGVEPFPVIAAVVILLAMAATAVWAAPRGAVLATFALPVICYALIGADVSRPVEAVMTGLLVVALPFFSCVSSQLNRTSLMLMSLRTEKDALIAELETAKAMSDEARHRAEEANLAKSRFLASMSHELRTPLNAILGFSEVMANEVLGPMPNQTYRDYANDIHSSGRYLLQLINEILDLSRIEAGRYQLNAEPLSLVHVVEDCCHMMTLEARSKDIQLLEQFEQGMPQLVADERALRQIALNLLANAVKFTSTGGEILVRVGWTAGGGQYFSIKDNGPGIAEDELPIVLSAFGQGAVAIKSAEQGTGLGLPIVQGLVALHGGSFDIRSKLHEGTEVVVTFPATRVMEEISPVPVRRAAAGGRRG